MANSANIDSEEVQKFESLADQWWDKSGKFRTLHDINPTRLKYIADRATLPDCDFIEVGCGGGILTESVARQGAKVVGIDPGESVLNVARIHAEKAGSDLDLMYLQSTAEEYCVENEAKFDVVAGLEMLEHVPDYSETVSALAKLAKPGGDLFFSTINRHPKAYVFMVLLGEYVLHVLPQGTHDYEKFIKPSELAQAARDAGLLVTEITGYQYNPFTRVCRLCNDIDVNYLVHAKKPGD